MGALKEKILLKTVSQSCPDKCIPLLSGGIAPPPYSETASVEVVKAIPSPKLQKSILSICPRILHELNVEQLQRTASWLDPPWIYEIDTSHLRSQAWILMIVANDMYAAAAQVDPRARCKRDTTLKEDGIMAKEVRKVMMGHEGLIKGVLGSVGSWSGRA